MLWAGEPRERTREILGGGAGGIAGVIEEAEPFVAWGRWENCLLVSWWQNSLAKGPGLKRLGCLLQLEM